MNGRPVIMAGTNNYLGLTFDPGCVEAASEAGVAFVVLDRPNPLGGERVEGPVAAPREVVASSFVNLAPGPLVHGLTLGEMARLVNAGLTTDTGRASGATGAVAWLRVADTYRAFHDLTRAIRRQVPEQQHRQGVRLLPG